MEAIRKIGFNMTGRIMIFGALMIFIPIMLVSMKILSESAALVLIFMGSAVEAIGVALALSMPKSGNKEFGAKSEKFDFGQLSFNVYIDIKCLQRTFSDSGLKKAEDQIEDMGVAVRNAKRVLKGNWHVTDKGYLFRGFKFGLPEREVIIEIDDNIAGLDALRKIRDGKMKITDAEFYEVHAHCERGAVVKFKIDQNGLILY